MQLSVGNNGSQIKSYNDRNFVLVVAEKLFSYTNQYHQKVIANKTFSQLVLISVDHKFEFPALFYFCIIWSFKFYFIFTKSPSIKFCSLFIYLLPLKLLPFPFFVSSIAFYEIAFRIKKDLLFTIVPRKKENKVLLRRKEGSELRPHKISFWGHLWLGFPPTS